MKFKYIAFIKDLSKDDLLLVGGKAANLGEMVNAGLPVPNAFVVTCKAYKEFLEKTGIRRKIFKILKETDVNNPQQLQENTAKIRKIIEKTGMPEKIKNEIIQAYKQLSKEFGKKEEYVAIRSSATAEDVPSASFAGLQLTILNVKGAKNVVNAVKKCWASLFTPRATFYRVQKGFEHEKVLIAIPIQKQMGALPREDYLNKKYKAGVGFTIHPATGEKDKIVIEAAWGQGESVVSGAITPDTYVINKKSGNVIEKRIGTKEKIRFTKLEGELEEIETPEEMRKIDCLTPDELKQLWQLSLKLEEHYKFPQDFEWVSENGKVYLVQSRPVTVFYEKKEEEIEVKHKPILKGLAASPGVAIGRVKIIEEIEKASEKMEKGNILVTRMTSPDWVPFMKIASGIITSEGGITAHAAIVSRELGIPCFPEKVEVLTDRGILSIEEIWELWKNGEEILVASFNIENGNIEWKKIKNVTRRISPVIEVKIGKIRPNDKIYTTSEHPFLVLDGFSFKFLPLEEIIKKKLCITSPTKISSLEKTSHFHIPRYFYYVIGAVMGDGYWRYNPKYGGSVVFTQKNIHSKSEFIKTIMKNYSNFLKYAPKIVEGGKAAYLYAYRVSHVHFFDYVQRNLEQLILSENDSRSLNYFLAGLADADGTWMQKGKKICITLNFLKDDVIWKSTCLALLKLKIPYINRIEKNSHKIRIEVLSPTPLFRKLKRLKINKEKRRTDALTLDSNLLNGIKIKNSVKKKFGINTILKRKRLVGIRYLENFSKFIEDKHQKEFLKLIFQRNLNSFRIFSLEKSSEEVVYNLEVEDNENYIIFSEKRLPFIVHNCIVGATDALTTLKDNQFITLDATRGVAYEGEIKELVARERAIEISPEEAAKLKTKTKILMNLGVPTEIEKYKHLPFDGIGLMRIEFIIAEWIKEHPLYLIEKNEEQKFVDKLAEGIAIVAKAIYPKFVVVRFSDLKTNEYRQLIGGEKFEFEEANPMLGWRGVSRYISKEFRDAFRLECRAIRKVREEMKLDNVWIMLPFVRNTWEVEECLKIMEEEGLKRGSKNFKIWLMAEVPSIVFLADKFSKLCDGFSIGSNDLTQLVLGVDRDSAILANIGYFDERDEAVKMAMKILIEEAHKNGITVSICGQSVSVYPEITEFLVKCGIDSVSVNPDAICKTKKLVYDVEEELKQRKIL